jgi:hypothetical protein
MGRLKLKKVCGILEIEMISQGAKQVLKSGNKQASLPQTRICFRILVLIIIQTLNPKNFDKWAVNQANSESILFKFCFLCKANGTLWSEIYTRMGQLA